MLPTELTKGMSRAEVWIVFWSTFTSKKERRRLAKHFQEMANLSDGPKIPAYATTIAAALPARPR